MWVIFYYVQRFRILHTEYRVSQQFTAYNVMLKYLESKATGNIND